jgi:hypothetical protein
MACNYAQHRKSSLPPNTVGLKELLPERVVNEQQNSGNDPGLKPGALFYANRSVTT